MNIIATVIEETQHVLAVDIPIEATTSLLDLAAFDSLSIVQLLERLECRFGVEMEPRLILPETFATPQVLADAFIQSLERANRE